MEEVIAVQLALQAESTGAGMTVATLVAIAEASTAVVKPTAEGVAVALRPLAVGMLSVPARGAGTAA